MTVDRAVPLNSLGPWTLGIDNVSSDFELPQGALRDAANVDLILSGSVRRRKGRIKRYNGASHDLWSDGTTFYGVDGQALSYFTRQPDGTLVPTAIRSGFPKSRPIAFLHYKSPVDRDRVYYSNGIFNGMLVGRTHYPWGVERPAGQPVLAAATLGGLDPGTYQVAMTFTSIFGEESGTGECVRVEVAAGGGITLSKIPAPVSNTVTRVRIYCSEANGKIPYLYAILPVGLTSVLIARSISSGHELKTQFMQPPPVGDVLALHYGRIYIAAGAVLSWSESLRPGLFMSNKLQPFPAPITILGSTTAGLIVASDRTYLLPGGEPKTMRPIEVLSHGAFKGSLQRDERRKMLYWLSPKGLCSCTDDGQGQNLTQGRLVVANARRAPALLREGNGLRQFIGVLRDGVPDPLVSTTWGT